MREMTLRRLVLALFAVAACSSEDSRTPEAELRNKLYCNQDWGFSPHKILNDGNPRCEAACASFTDLTHHAGCVLEEPTELTGTACNTDLSVEWGGWVGCCAPFGKTGDSFQGVRFVECVE